MHARTRTHTHTHIHSHIQTHAHTHAHWNSYTYWNSILVLPQNINWENVHMNNFKCTLDTKSRSFYLRFSTGVLLLMISFSRLKGRIHPTVIFVVNLQKPLSIFFVSVKKLPLCGKTY